MSHDGGHTEERERLGHPRDMWVENHAPGLVGTAAEFGVVQKRPAVHRLPDDVVVRGDERILGDDAGRHFSSAW